MSSSDMRALLDPEHAGEPAPAPLAMAEIAGKSDGYVMARSELEPETRHAVAAMNASADLFQDGRGGLGDHVCAAVDAGEEVLGGDLSVLSRTMTAQALTLDALFTQMLRKAGANMAQYPEAMERYMRLGLKAQAQSRATIEALVAMHQPREQTVRHVHVGPNGQAVFVENLHGGFGNARVDGRAHATVTPLLGEDTAGDSLPIPGGARKEAMPHARRGTRKRGAGGQ